MKPVAPETEQGPPVVCWLPQYVNARGPRVYLASLTPDASRTFASISECEQPAGMWLLTMYPQGRNRQFLVYFPQLEAARRAVELWVGQYWQTIAV